MALIRSGQEEMPREKLLNQGADSLSHAELLAVLLRTGTQGENVLCLSERLLRQFGGLRGLSRATAAELMELNGLKMAKAAALASALELGRRLVILEAEGETDTEGWKYRLRTAAFDSLSLEREIIQAFFLDRKQRCLGESELSYGGLSGAYLDLPVFFRQAVRCGASSVVLLHNHPDGTTEPSREDMKLTQYVSESLRLLGIELLDHYIAAEGRLYKVPKRR